MIDHNPGQYALYTANEISTLRDHGVTLIDPMQCYISRAVSLEKIGHEGSVFFPGTRIWGEQSYIGPNCMIGHLGPASLRNACLTRDVQIASGHVEGSLLLDRVSVGPNAFIRSGCLLEEESSIAHSVGLKQTILFPYVTLGSQINLCDILVAGGSSSEDHSEVGSSFIHFNFTPNGPRGDKATATLVGDVPRGVFLDQDRIFLGGQGGIVGPLEIGFGSVLAAGSVYRKDIGDSKLVLGGRPLPGKTQSRDPVTQVMPKALMQKNVRYIGNLVALRMWYRSVRALFWKGARSDTVRYTQRFIAQIADQLLVNAIKERIKQIERLLERLPADKTGDVTREHWRAFCGALYKNWIGPRNHNAVKSIRTLIARASSANKPQNIDIESQTYLAWIHELDVSLARDIKQVLVALVTEVEMLWDTSQAK